MQFQGLLAVGRNPYPSSCSHSFPSHHGPGMRAETGQGRSCGTIPPEKCGHSPDVADGVGRQLGSGSGSAAPQWDEGRQQDQPGTESTPVLLSHPGRNSQVGNRPQVGNKCHSSCNESALVPKKTKPSFKKIHEMDSFQDYSNTLLWGNILHFSFNFNITLETACWDGGDCILNTLLPGSESWWSVLDNRNE